MKFPVYFKVRNTYCKLKSMYESVTVSLSKDRPFIINIQFKKEACMEYLIYLKNNHEKLTEKQFNKAREKSYEILKKL